ncbi:MAG: DUF1553 domain-containing protein [Planctomycetes bacterium]|nr:DUF1553 domain-containing protein [Planctomycetota bacterium]
MFVRLSWCGVVASLLLAGTQPLQGAPEQIDFNRDIRPILSQNCFACHGPDKGQRVSGLRLDSSAGAYAKLKHGRAIVPHDPEASIAVGRIKSGDPDRRMPPPDSNKKLTSDQIKRIETWIAQGAEYQGHWSFTPPVKADVPRVPEAAGQWAKNPIDHFIHRRLQEEKLAPSPEASRPALIRRATLDLTGLPPTLEEIDAFLADKSPGAYEKVVDRLLASPHYGERMTLAWMDAARYGDSSVFHADGPRTMWPWRDWSINAYNDNMPFDRFTIEQLAGDHLPDSAVSQKIATGFLRNNGTTDEGGAIPEEYRVEYVVDRVKTTANVWLGLSMECSQCHDHKFDPITRQDYYGFYAFFNQSSDKGMQTRNGNAAPLIKTPSSDDLTKETTLNSQIEAQRVALEAIHKHMPAGYEPWLTEIQNDPNQASAAPENPLAWFALDEMQGDTITGNTAAKHKGTSKGVPDWQKGKTEGALRFNATTYFDLGQLGDFERDQAFSYGAWIKPTGNAAGAPIARMDDKNGHRGFDLYLTANKLAAHLINTWPDNAIKVTSKKAFSKDKWHHVFVTYDGASKAKGVQLYVDGQPQKVDVNVDTLTASIKTQKPLYLGQRLTGSKYKGLIDDIYLYERQLSNEEVARLAQADPLGPILKIAPDQRTAKHHETLRDTYLNLYYAPYKKANGELAKTRTELSKHRKAIPTVMIMQDEPQGRDTYLLMRGQYDAPDKSRVFEPATPQFLPPMPKGAPKNRLGLAQWLMMDEHPLTARVTVNRYWQMFFGTGLCESVMDFGAQGRWPNHPELLDWLAVDFRESGWDVKRMIKLMVTSATYRQTSRIPSELQEKDPRNLLLARGPRFRLQGEFIRDHALAISGLMVGDIGGPSVKPYQPPGLWNEVALSANVKFVQDHGDNLYRRSMYIYWKRSAPQPAMLIFDAPTREKCTIQRQRTNTPLQALALMNDVQFVEAARALAQRMIQEGGKTIESRLIFAHRLATAHRPSAKIIEILTDAYSTHFAAFEQDPSRADQLLQVGESKADPSLDKIEHAAWTMVANIILNLDQFVTRG